MEPDLLLGVLGCREPWTAESGRRISAVLCGVLGLDPGSALNTLRIGGSALLAAAVSSLVCSGGGGAATSLGTFFRVTTILPRTECGCSRTARST